MTTHNVAVLTGDYLYMNGWLATHEIVRMVSNKCIETREVMNDERGDDRIIIRLRLHADGFWYLPYSTLPFFPANEPELFWDQKLYLNQILTAAKKLQANT